LKTFLHIFSMTCCIYASGQSATRAARRRLPLLPLPTALQNLELCPLLRLLRHALIWR